MRTRTGREREALRISVQYGELAEFAGALSRILKIINLTVGAKYGIEPQYTVCYRTPVNYKSVTDFCKSVCRIRRPDNGRFFC